MMHGHEKSDPAIVAVKPTNKAERSAAEPVEPRAGTKGNAGQQSTRQTQSWARVSHALDRIRQFEPCVRFAVTHPRWEPHAGKPHVRICAGGARQLASLPLRRREFIALLGGAVAWPITSRAQQRTAIPRIAIVHPSDPVTSLNATSVSRWRAFFTELERLGFHEGTNLQVERYSGEGRSDRYAELAKEVADRSPNAVVTNSTRMASHFMTASRTVPVVAFTGDPIAGGLTTSLAKPSGNVTGVITDAGSEVLEKNIALLKELVPNIARVGVLVPRAFFDGPMEPHLQRAAQRTGVRTVNGGLESPINRLEYERVFAMLGHERAEALVVLPAPENILHAQTIVELAARDGLPAIYRIRDFSEAGGLMAYAIDTPDLYRRAAGQVGAILKGAMVNEVPFYQATSFKLIINLKAAKALGITVPPTLLARADEVIE